MVASAFRIAHVAGVFPPYRSGTSSAVWHQTTALARRGHEVHVFTPVSGATTASAAGVHVHVLKPMLRVGNASLTPSLIGMLSGFDIIHLHYPFFSSGVVWAAARMSRTAFVVTYLHDVLLPGPLGLLPRVYDRIIGRQVLADADRLLFLSLEYARASYMACLAGRRNVGEQALGVDERAFPSQPSRPSGQPLKLLMVAALDRPHYFKGVSVLFAALRSLQLPDISVTIVGDGDLRDYYERESRELGLSNTVHFAGSVSETDLPSYYAAGDVLIMPSVTRGEAFGLVMLEAMATNRPVIASRLPGVSVLVERTGGGLLFEPGNAAELARCIERLVDDPWLRQELGARGRKSVETTFNWEVAGGDLEQTYHDVLEARR